MPPVPKPPKSKAPKPAGAKPDNRRMLFIALGVAAVVAIALIAGSILLTRGGGSSSSATTSSDATSGPVALVAGIPQSGTTLGKSGTTTKLILFEDLQCPYCRQFTEDALPAIIDEYVKTGRVKVDWRGLDFIGPDSEKALKIALAAGKQNKLWEVIGLFYSKQGQEGSGWVTDQLIDDVLASVPGLDAAQVKKDAKSAAIAKQAAAMTAEAQQRSVQGTPTFFIQNGLNAPYQISVTSLTPEAFRPVLNDALKG
jgi:protein-disulfide isomerase